MKPRVMAELLTQYVDRMNAGRDDTKAYLSLFDSKRRELAPLFGVVQLLKTILFKSEPSPVFVETLGMGLRLAAEQAIRERRHEQASWAPSRRGVLIGAAAAGSVAAIVLLARSRGSRAA